MIQILHLPTTILHPGPRNPHHTTDVPRRPRIQHPQRQHHVRRVHRREHQVGVVPLQRRVLARDERLVCGECEEGCVCELARVSEF